MKPTLWIVSAAAASSGLALAMFPAASAHRHATQKFDVKKRPPVAALKFSPPQYANVPPAAYQGSPDATLTVKPTHEGYHFAHISSRGTGYSRTGSPYYVVDIVVPPNYKGSGLIEHTKIYGQMTTWADIDTEGACSTAMIDAAIYKRIPTTRSGSYGYKLVTGGGKKGIWNVGAEPGAHNYCDAGISFVFKVPTPESKQRQSVVYRVMVKPKVAGVIVPATVGWHWEY